MVALFLTVLPHSLQFTHISTKMHQSRAMPLRCLLRETFIHVHPEITQDSHSRIVHNKTKVLETNQMPIIGEYMNKLSMLTNGSFYSRKNELTRATCNNSAFYTRFQKSIKPELQAYIVRNETAALLPI